MATQHASKLNVLFIGNSYTERNDVPGLIAGLAAARGRKLEHWLISAGGASLRRHWNKGEALEVIRAPGYDYVVLQEQSTLPIKNAARMHESVRLFDKEIRAAGAKTVLYMTWARAHAPETQKVIAEAYESIGKELGATVAPVGRAWERVLAMNEGPELHDKDGSHPTPAGSYLAACVLLRVLFGENAAGIAPVEGLTAEAARLLQEAADATPLHG